MSPLFFVTNCIHLHVYLCLTCWFVLTQNINNKISCYQYCSVHYIPVFPVIGRPYSHRVTKMHSVHLVSSILPFGYLCEILWSDYVYYIILAAAETVCTSTQWQPTDCEPSGYSGDMTAHLALIMILLIISCLF